MKKSFWNDLPVRAKFMLYGGLITFVALVITGTALMRLESNSFRERLLEQVASMASVAGRVCASSLVFDDVEFAEQLMLGLGGERSIQRVCIYTTDGSRFASFESPGHPPNYSLPEEITDYRFTSTSLEIVQAINWHGEQVGTIYVQAGLGELTDRMYRVGVAMAILLTVSLILSLLLAGLLQRGLSRPIIALQETADRVRRDRDYTARAPQFGRDELGRLTEAFNEMLAVIERREKALRASELRYAHLLGRIDEVVFRMAIPDGRLEFCSPGALSLFGHSAETMVNDPDLLVSLIRPDSRGGFDTLLSDAAAGTVSPVIDYEIIDGRGRERHISQTNYAVRDDRGRLVSIEGLFINITERVMADRESEQLRTELAQAHKLEALGTLTGGIAHDFNNILSAIMGNASLALDDVPKDHELAGTLGTILQASERAAKLTKQILAFSRQGQQEKSAVDLPELLEEALTLLRASLPATISIKTRIDAGLPKVLADPTQLHQVIMNLCTNAHYAMRGHAGLIDIGLRTCIISDADAERYPESTQGPGLELTISDSGEGIEPEILEHIFEPFYSTKPEGEGTGMGLAVVYGIIREHGGSIAVESQCGLGTTFLIRLPAQATTVDEERKETAGSIGGHGHVLVVDDEQLIADLVRRMLSRLGYQATSFTNPWLAIEVFEAEPEKYEVVVTDFTMPNLTGLDLTRRIREIRADIPVIISTGNRERVDQQEIDRLGSIEIVNKPFDLQHLGSAVHNSMRRS